VPVRSSGNVGKKNSSISLEPAPHGYDPERCVLCGENTTELVIAHPLSMSSDSRLASIPLHKVSCSGCGLVRNGDPFDKAFLSSHYQNSYTLVQTSVRAEPRIRIHGRNLARSAFFHEWLSSSLIAAGVSQPHRIAEIGCGDGLLLQRFSLQNPQADVLGIDPQPGTSSGRLRLVQGEYTKLTGEWDLIYAVAVLEHVPRPDHFIAHLRSCLSPGGVLILTQPSQDNGSNDIFYFDHLHHFFADHVAALAAQAGMRELIRVTSHCITPEFSLQIFGSSHKAKIANLNPSDYSVRSTVDTWNRIFLRTNSWLEQNPEPIVVWGLGMTFTLLQAYTKLGGTTIRAGIDDNPDRFVDTFGTSFPVVTSKEATRLSLFASPVLFTFRPPPLLKRLPLGNYLDPLVAE
jgi:2-polyprenyl-3-methyl-5-hydroxy-6-metoxy-1,4-benzoquinol methylase